jgi:NitT/TauT family transport system substrate-binding protein
MSKIRIVLVGLALAAAAVATGASAQVPEKVVFAKASPWGLSDAPIPFAIELGFFKQEDIDPQFVVVGGSYAGLQQILGGAAQTGFITNESLPISLQPGATPLPLRAVYNYYRNSPIFEIVVLANSPIRKLADLKGKRIGVLSLATGNVPLTKAAMSQVGLSPAEYSLLPVGVGAQAAQALASGQIDALNLWYTMHAQIQESGVPLRVLAFPPGLDNFPSTAIAFSEAYIRSNPATVARYGRALTKGTVACVANPEGCVRALWRLHPSSKPAGDEAKNMPSALKIMQVAFTKLVPPAGLQYGAYSQADWDNLLKAFVAGGAMTTANVPLDRVYTNEFVIEYNKFDKAAVEAAAKAYK